MGFNMGKIFGHDLWPVARNPATPLNSTTTYGNIIQNKFEFFYQTQIVRENFKNID